MRLKFDAWMYRKTGYMSNYAKRCEYEYLRSILTDVYTESEDVCDFNMLVSIKLGLWHAEHKFLRSTRGF